MSRADDVVEACADALLTAAAAALPEPVTPDEAAARAWQSILLILERTAREGGKPR